MRYAPILGLAAFTWMFACDQTPSVAFRSHPPSHTPERTELSPAVRAQVAGFLDVEAMDRLLSSMTPDQRRAFLASFADLEAAARGEKVETRAVSFVIQLSDAEQQLLLERVWAPYWDRLPPEARSDPGFRLPGRALAAARKQDSAEVRLKEQRP